MLLLFSFLFNLCRCGEQIPQQHFRKVDGINGILRADLIIPVRTDISQTTDRIQPVGKDILQVATVYEYLNVFIKRIVFIAIRHHSFNCLFKYHPAFHDSGFCVCITRFLREVKNCLGRVFFCFYKHTADVFRYMFRWGERNFRIIVVNFSNFKTDGLEGMNIVDDWLTIAVNNYPFTATIAYGAGCIGGKPFPLLPNSDHLETGICHAAIRTRGDRNITGIMNVYMKERFNHV